MIGIKQTVKILTCKFERLNMHFIPTKMVYKHSFYCIIMTFLVGSILVMVRKAEHANVLFNIDFFTKNNTLMLQKHNTLKEMKINLVVGVLL